MNDEELAAIEARCNAATKGPWTLQCAEHLRKGKIAVYGGPDGGRIDVALIQPWMGHEDENAAFIAHARTDIPALIAEVRRLTVESERVTHDFSELLGYWEEKCQELEAQAAALKEVSDEKYCKRLEELEAQCAAMREALEEYHPIIAGFCSEYGQQDIASRVLNSSNAGADLLLKRLKAAEAICEAVEMNFGHISSWQEELEAWHKAKGES